MNFDDLRHFLHVADEGSVRGGANAAGVSPATMSRAVKALENHLNVTLFYKVGRNIELNEFGRHLQERAREIVQQTDALKHEIAVSKEAKEIRLAGRSVILAEFGRTLAKKWSDVIPNSVFVFEDRTGIESQKLVSDRLADFSLTTQVPVDGHLSRKVGEFSMVTCVGMNHPLRRKMRAHGKVSIHDVLRYEFAAPALPIFGFIKGKRAADGWRDDKHPRKFRYISEDLAIIEACIEAGDAVGYLPAFRLRRGIERLEIPDCLYECHMSVYLGKKKGRAAPYIDQAWRESSGEKSNIEA